MSKRLILGLLLIVGAIAVLGTEAHAGCCCDPLICASWITGSGMPTGLVEVPTGPGGFEPSDNACPGVIESQGVGSGEGDFGFGVLQAGTPVTSLTLRLVGTVGVNCGLDGNQSCDIEGVAVCGGSVNKKAETPGPLTVDSDAFAQTDFSTNAANFRFQLNTFQQEQLCPDDTFVAFFAREGFFEACVNGTGPNNCVREFCRVDVGGIQRDVPRTYNCKPI